MKPKSNSSIPFLDTNIIQKQDGTIKLCIYRKPTHTNQYLQFQSHHPLHQKLGVVRTLLDRKDTIVTKEEDRQEKNIIKQALNLCGYLQWAIDKVKSDRTKPKQHSKYDKDEKEKSKGLVVIPYIKGLSKRLSRTFKKHGFSTAMKLHKTLRNILVHPKDKRNPMQTAEAIYEFI